MSSTVKYLKDKLEEAKRKVAASESYREMKMLERMLLEIEPQEETVHPHPLDKRVTYKRKKKESPEKNRMLTVYNIIEEMVKQAGGEIEVDLLKKKLYTEHRKIWKTMGANNIKRWGTLTAYIGHINKREKSKRLMLMPVRVPGSPTRTRYTKIITTNLKKE